VELDGGKCREARVALGAAAPTPQRAVEAEAFLAGKALDEKSIAEAAALAAASARPITDQRGSAEFRKEICRVLVERALRDCGEGGRQR
jgi:carbon-monoxide dehydrogenase medium subunit